MPTTTITWQQAMNTVEQLSIADQLRLITELLLRIKNSVKTTESIDLLTLAGVGAEVWQEIDTDTYINEERDSYLSARP